MVNRFPENMGSSSWKRFAVILGLVVVAVLAYQLGRRDQPALEPILVPRNESLESEPATKTEQAPRPASAATAAEPSAVPYLPRAPGEPVVGQPEALPSPLPEAPPEGDSGASLFFEEKKEDPASCLTPEAFPKSVEVFGASGRAVQLTVRVRNTCAKPFIGAQTYFRVYAVSHNGFDLASARGHFYGTIPAMGSAETLISVESDPRQVGRYRVEILQ